MLLVHVSWTYMLLLWSYSSRSQRRSSQANSQVRYPELRALNHDSRQKRFSRGNKYGACKEAKYCGQAKDALQSANKEGYHDILENATEKYYDTYRERMTEQGLGEDHIRRRGKVAMMIRVFTIGTLLKNTVGQCFCAQKNL